MKIETFWKLCKWNDDKRNMEARRLQEATCLVYRIFYFLIQLSPWYGRNGTKIFIFTLEYLGKKFF